MKRLTKAYFGHSLIMNSNLPDILEENARKASSSSLSSMMQDKKSSVPAAAVAAGAATVNADATDKKKSKTKRSWSFRNKIKIKSIELFGSSKKRSPSSPCLLTVADSAALNTAQKATTDDSRGRSNSVTGLGAVDDTPQSPLSPTASERRQRLLESKFSTFPEDCYQLASRGLGGSGQQDSVDGDEGRVGLSGDDVVSAVRPSPDDCWDRDKPFERGMRRTRSLPGRSRKHPVVRQHIFRSRYCQVCTLLLFSHLNLYNFCCSTYLAKYTYKVDKNSLILQFNFHTCLNYIFFSMFVVDNDNTISVHFVKR